MSATKAILKSVDMADELMQDTVECAAQVCSNDTCKPSSQLPFSLVLLSERYRSRARILLYTLQQIVHMTELKFCQY